MFMNDNLFKLLTY